MTAGTALALHRAGKKRIQSAKPKRDTVITVVCLSVCLSAGRITQKAIGGF